LNGNDEDRPETLKNRMDGKMSGGATWYFCNPKDGTEMVLVPGGWFWMGSGDEVPDAYNSEGPRHLRRVAPFYMALECVTVGQYGGFVEETGHGAGSEWKGDPDDHPVRFVNWHDAVAYCRWAGLRLPTEAEWELAARGYDALRFPWGAEWEEGVRLRWGNQRMGRENTASVFSYPEGVSPFGIFQMSGNVWEWCRDEYRDDAYKNPSAKEPASGGGTEAQRVLRGGTWNCYSSGRLFRAAHRDAGHPKQRGPDNGFRAAASLEDLFG